LATKNSPFWSPFYLGENSQFSTLFYKWEGRSNRVFTVSTIRDKGENQQIIEKPFGCSYCEKRFDNIGFYSKGGLLKIMLKLQFFKIAKNYQNI